MLQKRGREARWRCLEKYPGICHPTVHGDVRKGSDLAPREGWSLDQSWSSKTSINSVLKIRFLLNIFFLMIHFPSLLPSTRISLTLILPRKSYLQRFAFIFWQSRTWWKPGPKGERGWTGGYCRTGKSFRSHPDFSAHPPSRGISGVGNILERIPTHHISLVELLQLSRSGLPLNQILRAGLGQDPFGKQTKVR